MSLKTERESKLEKDSGEFAESRGWWQFKIMKASKNGVPDRYYARRGRSIFVEYKKEDKPPTAQQLKRHKDMRDHGIEVFVVDTFEQAKEILR